MEEGRQLRTGTFKVQDPRQTYHVGKRGAAHQTNLVSGHLCFNQIAQDQAETVTNIGLHQRYSPGGPDLQAKGGELQQHQSKIYKSSTNRRSKGVFLFFAVFFHITSLISPLPLILFFCSLLFFKFSYFIFFFSHSLFVSTTFENYYYPFIYFFFTFLYLYSSYFPLLLFFHVLFFWFFIFSFLILLVLGLLVFFFFFIFL